MVPRDGVEPPTPAFSGLVKTAKSMILRNARECKGTLGNTQERVLFPYCSRAAKRRFLQIHFADGLATTLRKNHTTIAKLENGEIPHARGCASCMTRLYYRVGCKGSALKVACSRPLILAPRGPYVPRAPPIWSWVGSGTFA